MPPFEKEDRYSSPAAKISAQIQILQAVFFDKELLRRKYKDLKSHMGVLDLESKHATGLVS